MNIDKTLFPEASQQELELLRATCERTGLDSAKRQIYLLPKFDKKTQKKIHRVAVSIDGFRVIANRTGLYAGQLGPFWCGDDGKWVDVWLSQEKPRAAKIGVLRKDFAEPLYSVALFAAYAQNTEVWSRMGSHMIAKVCEALCLRRAFPDEFSGVYSDDELQMVDDDKKENKKDPEKKEVIKSSVLELAQQPVLDIDAPVKLEQLASLKALALERKIKMEDLSQKVREFGKKNSTELTQKEYNIIHDWVNLHE